MTRFDSESASTRGDDSSLKTTLKAAGRGVARHDLEAKFAVAAAAFVALGLLVRRAYTSQFGDNMGAILVWFTLIFAVGFALLGGCIKVWGAIQRRRKEWE